uniref:Transcription elongation factor 1 homolog n=1 Tax=Trypanosoma congolense (strain IL3000) TaxID=1068625 RepID=G0UIY5_TRYCI|nr:conserved hypothetical protein [Trypanosoma congolense IL3000]
MSGDGGNGGDPPPPQLSKNSRTFMKKKLEKRAKKGSNSGAGGSGLSNGARFVPRSWQCLKKFNCPVCRMKGSVRVEVNCKEAQAVVNCIYCIQLVPRPVDLPYPFTTSFVPRLENRADVFFKFNELYRGLEQQAASLDATGNALQGDVKSHEGGVLSVPVLKDEGDSQKSDVCEEGEEERISELHDGGGVDGETVEQADEIDDVHAFFGESDQDE